MFDLNFKLKKNNPSSPSPSNPLKIFHFWMNTVENLIFCFWHLNLPQEQPPAIGLSPFVHGFRQNI
jgi:hypothetical protein